MTTTYWILSTVAYVACGIVTAAKWRKEGRAAWSLCTIEYEADSDFNTPRWFCRIVKGA